MGFNVGGLYVRSRNGVDAATVAKAITACWVGRGAKPDPEGKPLALEPLGLAKTKRLGYAIVDAADWIVVAESERYTFDHGIALHVAKELGTECIWYVLAGATNAGVALRLGKSVTRVDGYGQTEDLVAELPLAFTYYDELDGDDLTLVALTGVPADRYVYGPLDDDDGAPPEPPAEAPMPTTRDVAGPYEPVRVRDGGHLLLRDAITLAWFLEGKVERPIAAALDRYVALIPADTLRWALIGSSSTDVRPFTAATLARAKANLRKADAYFWLGSDDEPETGEPQKDEPRAPAFMFLASRDEDEEVAVLEMRFASHFVWPLGIAAFVDFAVEMTRTLPLVSGHGGLQLAGHPMVTGFSSRANRAIPEIARAHPGYDACTNAAMGLGTRVRSAQWLTFLGPALTKRTLAALAKTGTELIEAGKNLVVRTGVHPEPDPDPRLIGKVARALLPVTWIGSPFQSQTFEDENGQRDPVAHAAWEFRFMGGLDGALAHLSAQQDVGSLVRALEIRLAQRRYADAQAALAAATKAGATEATLGAQFIALSRLAEADNRNDEAIAWMQRFADGSPENTYTLWALGELYQRLGMKKESDAAFARYATLAAKK